MDSKRLLRAAGYGFLLWLIPFVISFALFPIKKTNAPLFMSAMSAVAVASATLLLNLYFGRAARPAPAEGWLLGLIWLAMSWMLDWPMFAAGPMKMTLAGYLSEIGVVYLAYPVLTIGAARLLRHGPQRELAVPVGAGQG